MKPVASLVSAVILGLSGAAHAQNSQLEPLSDDSGYGAIFDKLENEKASMTDDEKSENLIKKVKKVHEFDRVALKEVCAEFSNLYFKGHPKTVFFGINDLATNYSSGSVMSKCWMKYSDVYYQAKKVPEIYNDGKKVFVAAQAVHFSGSGIFKPAYKKSELFMDYLRQSAKLGYINGQYSYGATLLNTGGDKKESFILLNKAAEQGDTRAVKVLKDKFDYDFPIKSANAVGASQSVSAIDASSNVTTQAMPSVMAKDYWIKQNHTSVFNKSGTVIGTLDLGVAVTTYGENADMGKIDLVEDKWVKLSDLTTENIFNESNEVKIVSNIQGPRCLDLLIAGKKREQTGTTEGLFLEPNINSKGEVVCETEFAFNATGMECKFRKNAIYCLENRKWVLGWEIRNREKRKRDTRYVSGSSLNYRNSPSGSKLGSFPFSTELVIYDRSGKWVRVSKAREPEKWVHEDYLSKSKPSKPRRTVTSNNQTTNSNKQRYRKLSDAECGRLRIKMVTTVKTQAQFDAIERQLTRGGCNSQEEARKKAWEWVR